MRARTAQLSMVAASVLAVGMMMACFAFRDPARARTASLPEQAPTHVHGEDLEAELRRAGFSTSGWETDFRKHSTALEEITSGGPGKDGIPAIDHPDFVSVQDADRWLDDREPVQVLELNGEVRAYPLQVLIWHEIVNDVVGATPVAVTYCPLCNTAVVFRAVTTDGGPITFGTTGNLRFSDLVMYDRQTESWWQQITGEAIVGELTGSRLEFLPSSLVSWAEFKGTHAQGNVLSRDTGYARPYGENPYVGYDTGSPFLYRGAEDNRLPPTERVATVSLGDQAVAFPFSALEQEPVVHHVLAGQPFVVFYQKGTASALDRALVADGRDVGATGVFRPEVQGRTLTFQARDGEIRDVETGSTWSVLGAALSGPLKGARLEPIVHGNHFWFSWAVFKPNTAVYRGPR